MSDSLVSLRARAERWRDDYDDVTIEREAGETVLALLDRLEALEMLASTSQAALEAAERERDNWRDKCLAHREAFSEARAELAVTKSANASITKLTGNAGVTTPETGSDNPQRRCAAASDTPAESVAVSEWRKASDLWQARAEAAEARAEAAEARLLVAQRAFEHTNRCAQVFEQRAYSAEERLLAAEKERDRFKLMAERGQDAETEKIERGTRLLAAQQALRDVLDCKGPYSGTVSEFGGYPALCHGCVERARAALAAVGRVPAQEDKP